MEIDIFSRFAVRRVDSSVKCVAKVKEPGKVVKALKVLRGDTEWSGSDSKVKTR